MTATAAPSANGHHVLLPQHAADLARSGIDAQTAAGAGIHSESDPRTIARILHWRAWKGGDAMLFPYAAPDGSPTGYIRVKPDVPLQDKKKPGRLRKYEGPKGVPTATYFVPGTADQLQDASVPLIITEGEKKTLAGVKTGFLVVGIPGVDCWSKPREKGAGGRPKGARQMRDDLAALPLQGRRVFIAFDYPDCVEKCDVRWAEFRLAEQLAARGADVRAVRLKPDVGSGAAGGAKQGLDDFLLAHGPDGLRDRLACAEPPTRPKPTRPLLPDADSIRLARLYLEKQAAHSFRPLLAFYREKFWGWTGRAWRASPDSEQRAALAKFVSEQRDLDAAAALERWNGEGCPPSPYPVGTALVTNILQALTGEVMLPREVPQPGWLGAAQAQAQARRSLIALENGLLDVDALLCGKSDVLLPHSPLWFSPVCLPYRFDPAADSPRWRAFLTRNLGDDPGKQLLLEQFAGYLLTPDTSLQCFLLLLGEGANGKSVICAVLSALLGEGNVSSVPLELFGDRFRLMETLGKLANITSEVGELDRIAEGVLKAYVTGDPIQFEEKFKPAYTARPTARLVLATNNAPRFSDKSDGVWRRMLLLKCAIQIPPAERVAGMDKPEFWAGELPGILNWAVAGLYRLRQEGRFAVPDSCQQDADRLRAESNPARLFLDDHYEADPACDCVTCASAYRSYREWCQTMGYIPLADVGFGREVSRRFKDMKRAQRTVSARREWCYVGLRERPTL